MLKNPIITLLLIKNNANHLIQNKIQRDASSYYPDIPALLKIKKKS
jgi:hypothetical protein